MLAIIHRIFYVPIDRVLQSKQKPSHKIVRINYSGFFKTINGLKFEKISNPKNLQAKKNFIQPSILPIFAQHKLALCMQSNYVLCLESDLLFRPTNRHVSTALPISPENKKTV